VTTAWVHAEVAEAGPEAATLELLAAARTAADVVEVVAFGPGASEAAETLGAHGARRVYACDDASTASPRAGASIMERLIHEHRPELVLFPTSYAGRDLAARLQARTGSTLMSNATAVSGPDRARTEILGGTRIVDVRLEGPTPRLVLLKPRSAEANPVPDGGAAEVLPVAADVPADLREPRVLARHVEAGSGPSLDDARVVVAGGRGLGSPEGFEILAALAGAIEGAAVGASRAAVDAGWMPYAAQIGQTGKTVKPDVYIAVGISGALQHLVGMKGSRRVIAVNKDADAPMMRLADVGVIGDLTRFVPALTQEIRRRTGS
jgi:electron transfer flavoprotein alpha subunit